MPAKYVVKDAAGAVDQAATLAKWSEGHGHLERRMGSGDVPPKTAEEYKVTVPESLAETIKADELANSADFKGFLGKMHGLGLNQQQLDGVVGELLTRSAAKDQRSVEAQVSECAAALAQTWPSQAVREQNIGLAFKAFNAFADEGDRELMDQIGNNPIVVRLLAAVGKELQEDTPIVANSPEAKSWEDQVAELKSQPGYMDRNHPQHAQLMARQEALYAKRYGTKKQVLGGGATFTMR